VISLLKILLLGMVILEMTYEDFGREIKIQHGIFAIELKVVHLSIKKIIFSQNQ